MTEATNSAPVTTDEIAIELLPSQAANITSVGIANPNAKPFVPASSRQAGRPGSLGAGARPFVPSTSTAPRYQTEQPRESSGGDRGQRGGRINAAAAAFVPAATAGSRLLSSSSNAPAFVPRGTTDGRDPRGSYRADQRQEDAKLGFQGGPPTVYGEADVRAAGGHPMPAPIMLNGPSGYGKPSTRPGRGRGTAYQVPPQSAPYQQPFAGLKSGRGSPARPFDNNSWGRGRGRGAPHHAGPGYHAGHQIGIGGALGRLHRMSASMAEGLVPHLQLQTPLALSQMQPDLQAQTSLPETLQHFHSLYPLEDVSNAREVASNAFGVQSILVKGLSSQDNRAYTLRTIGRMQMRPSPDLAAAAGEIVRGWGGLEVHPYLGPPREALLSGEAGSAMHLVVVHDYFPAAATLEAAHLQPQLAPNGLVQMMSAEEDTLWTYLMQLAAALKAVHSVHMACRASLHPSKVLLIETGRIRIGSLGVSEMVTGLVHDPDEVAAAQLEDLNALGRLLLQLACSAPQHPSLDYCAAHYSPAFTRILASLLGHHEPITGWRQLTAALGERAFEELSARQLYTDAITAQLSQELENGRLLRVLAKLSMITERADADPQWAETGDRYLLKLFRDFVFHQYTEEGAPLLEWGHIVECLAKLDAGAPERVVLLSRDEASMLVVSYADIKGCAETSFQELRKAGAMPRPAH